MFSDIYKIIDKDGILLEVEGKSINRTESLDDALFGSNASAEEQQESLEASSVSGIDIVLNHKLVETGYKKDEYKNYIKEYMKEIRAKLEQDKPERVPEFLAGATKAVKSILSTFKDFQFYMGESMDPRAGVGLLNFREDGETPYMIFFKDGLQIEKC